jgi:acetyl esterase
LTAIAGPENRRTVKPSRTITYKQIGDMDLKLHVFDPAAAAKRPLPAIVFFFGGGWNGGSPSQFYHQSNYLAAKGVLAIAAEYRTKSNGGVEPSGCVKDGKAAIRYVRAHAKALGVDPHRIAAGGGSAGGHVAAATGTVSGFEHEGEDLAVSSRPDLLVLFNPVYDNSRNGYGFARVKAYWESISPLHNISALTPPATVFFGSNEKLVKREAMEAFQSQMREHGIRSDLFVYEGQGHGFFNFGKENGKWFFETMTEAHKFLADHGYITGKPSVDTYLKDCGALK